MARSPSARRRQRGGAGGGPADDLQRRSLAGAGRCPRTGDVGGRGGARGDTPGARAAGVDRTRLDRRRTHPDTRSVAHVRPRRHRRLPRRARRFRGAQRSGGAGPLRPPTLRTGMVRAAARLGRRRSRLDGAHRSALRNTVVGLAGSAPPDPA